MLNVRSIEFSTEHNVAAPALAENEAHVWIVGLDAADPGCAKLLAPAERARALRFTSDLHRVRFIQRRSALRTVLSAYTGLAPASIVFVENDYGKPALAAHPGLSFSTSHSESLALIAVGRGMIGIDVEWLRFETTHENVAARFFASSEAASLAALGAGDRVRGFFNAWTRKEAIVKALGAGLSIPLDAFEVTLRPDEPAAVVGWNVPGAAVTGWQLHHLEPRPGYVGALAFNGV